MQPSFSGGTKVENCCTEHCSPTFVTSCHTYYSCMTSWGEGRKLTARCCRPRVLAAQAGPSHLESWQSLCLCSPTPHAQMLSQTSPSRDMQYPITRLHSVVARPRGRKKVWAPVLMMVKRIFSFKTVSFVLLFCDSLTDLWANIVGISFGVLGPVSEFRLHSVKRSLLTGYLAQEVSPVLPKTCALNSGWRKPLEEVEAEETGHQRGPRAC